MNPLPFILLAITLPLLLGGCGVEGPVEEKQKKVKEEVKPELADVNYDEFYTSSGIFYLRGSDTPYTGKTFSLYETGKKEMEGNLKNGKQDGLWTEWHENGQKQFEGNWKDGKLVSGKYWNNKGEPVDCLIETLE